MNGKQSHKETTHSGSKTASSIVAEQDRKNLQSAIAALCEQQGVYLIALELRGSKERRIVEVYVDKPEGISLDECSDLSNLIGDVLESMKAFPAAYRLDVSSPGVERPLTHLWQFQRNVGRLLALEFQDGSALKGRITAVEGESITLENPHAGKGGKHRASAPKQASGKQNEKSATAHVTPIFPITIQYKTIKQAIIELEF